MKTSKLVRNTKDQNRKNIALVGHMGSGKTILGLLISKKLDLAYIDSDQLIEKNLKNTINDIFNNEGEAYFRHIEEETVLKCTNKTNLVLSLGGGAILSKKIRKRLKDNFFTVFIDTDIDILVERLKKSKRRPLINNTNIEDKIKELDIKRRKFYLLSDIILKSQTTIKKTLEEFLAKYNTYYETNN
tara:strand:+ start:958 stop:1518 length:561 start_codon:yes stop_codon:yes gene_type:complete